MELLKEEITNYLRIAKKRGEKLVNDLGEIYKELKPETTELGHIIMREDVLRFEELGDQILDLLAEGKTPNDIMLGELKYLRRRLNTIARLLGEYQKGITIIQETGKIQDK